MHLVYIVRPGRNEELRFSLRSVAANLPVESVTIVGDPPGWVTGCRVLPGNRYHTKVRNVYDNVRIAAEDPQVPAEFVLMNDDFYVLEPVTTIPTLHRGPLAAHRDRLHPHRTWWTVSLDATIAFLRDRGFENPLSYELHTPMPVVKEKMAAVLSTAADYQPDNPPQWRTIYGNLAGIGGELARDAKIAQPDRPARERGTFLSTDDGAFALEVVAELRERFPEPSPYEARKPPTRNEEHSMPLYRNVTTRAVVEDDSGRLEKLARWKRISDAEVETIATAADADADATTADDADTPAVPVGTPPVVPDEGWKNADIVAWAKEHNVDLDGATIKADMLAKIAAATTDSSEE